ADPRSIVVVSSASASVAHRSACEDGGFRVVSLVGGLVAMIRTHRLSRRSPRTRAYSDSPRLRRMRVHVRPLVTSLACVLLSASPFACSGDDETPSGDLPVVDTGADAGGLDVAPGPDAFSHVP